MKIYRTNQESIDKGIFNEWKNGRIIYSYIENSWYLYDIVTYQVILYFKIDNRIKGFCLKECK